jgi:cyclopropane fatty-acyl-phospholipid synthase-like methyltransferase
MTEFDTAWAHAKLNLPKRRRELHAHIEKWLREIKGGSEKSVLDIGCGCGDLLDICREYGHSIQGVDCHSGDSPMGAAYAHRCVEYLEENRIPWVQSLDDLSGPFDIIHCRGAIEQIGEHAMHGPPHSEHHNAKLLNWTADAIPFLREFIYNCSELLRFGGILLIAANGTGETDSWYDEIVRRSGDESGLELVAHEGLLLHKWRKR